MLFRSRTGRHTIARPTLCRRGECVLESLLGQVQVAEAAADLGSPPWKAFWQVTFPLSIPGVLAGCFDPARHELLNLGVDEVCDDMNTFITLLGTMVGLSSGYLGGRYDAWVQRVVDIFFALPQLPGHPAAP